MNTRNPFKLGDRVKIKTLDEITDLSIAMHKSGKLHSVFSIPVAQLKKIQNTIWTVTDISTPLAVEINDHLPTEYGFWYPVEIFNKVEDDYAITTHS